MKRSFKAATVFAGVGAMTGAFAPAAFANTAHVPTVKECGANNGGVSTWVHLYYPNDDHPAECAGGSGITNAGATIASFCPGNNYGTIFATHRFDFSPKQVRAHVSRFDGHTGYDKVSGIDISLWSGYNKCT
jgi:hypothetical protein